MKPCEFCEGPKAEVARATGSPADIEALVRRHVGENDALELAWQEKLDELKASQVRAAGSGNSLELG